MENTLLEQLERLDSKKKDLEKKVKNFADGMEKYRKYSLGRVELTSCDIDKIIDMIAYNHGYGHCLKTVDRLRVSTADGSIVQTPTIKMFNVEITPLRYETRFGVEERTYEEYERDTDGNYITEECVNWRGQKYNYYKTKRVGVGYVEPVVRYFFAPAQVEKVLVSQFENTKKLLTETESEVKQVMIELQRYFSKKEKNSDGNN